MADYKGMDPSWEVWLAIQHMPIPQQTALFGTPSSVVKLEKPTVSEVLAELAKIQKAKEVAKKEQKG